MTNDGRRILPLALAALLALTACSHMPHLHSPFHHKPPPPPEVADELVLAPQEGTTAASFPQYWKRNAIVIDLATVSGTGGIVVKPKDGATCSSIFPCSSPLRCCGLQSCRRPARTRC